MTGWSIVPFVGVGVLAALAVFAQAAPPDPEWKPVGGRIVTRWAKDVRPEAPLPEYPRPTMTRERWQNLNGLWSYAISAGADARPKGAEGKILVPFPIESALSGVGKSLEPEGALWYWRTISIPSEWKGQRVLLHFGAVDWHARVSVNGKEMGEHKGGYTPFSFDITEALKAGENELVVRVMDPTDTGGQPRGKQFLTPGGIWYTPTSGIWQTVWLEPVPEVSIAGLDIHASAADGTVRVGVTPSRAGAGCGVEIEVLSQGKSVAKVRSDSGMSGAIRLPDARAWTPDDPFLYDLKVRLLRDGAVVDEVGSYAGLRDISVGPDEHGVTRLLLNGKALFQYGPLDQGFWPDGLYTAPTDEALKFDVEAVKRMGGNMLRKHVKVEPERLYTWCDRLGVLVWQDMPSPFFRNEKDTNIQPLLSDEWRGNFERELGEMVAARGNHPSIVVWVPFNEGWGQNDMEWARKMALRNKELDPSRLVNNASGWTDMKVGDTYDEHHYPDPTLVAPRGARAGVLGEFGGLGLPLEGHTWVEKNNWGYVSYKDKGELTEAYCAQMRQLPVLIGQGLSAAVYTQTTDVEIECNGWLTYDREVWKIDPERAAAVTKRLYEPAPIVRTVLGSASTGAAGVWRYTTEQPADSWTGGAFDDSAWKEGKAGFGTEGTPGSKVGTEWKTGDIWLRRTFELESTEFTDLQLAVHHDEDAEVYVNGLKVLTLKGYTSGYVLAPIPASAVSAFKRGVNTLAIHCRQTRGGQYIDAGLVDLEPAPAPAKKARSAAYDSRTIAGFDVRINRELARDEPAILERVLVQLAADLDEVAHMVPGPAAEALRDVTIWVELQGYTGMGHGGRGMCCHWSPAWLTSNGLPAEKAGGVEIINAKDFLSWRRDQPYMLFHEMAHAYHWRLRGYDGEIERVYRGAMEKELYEKVGRNSVPLGETVRAYAATNSHEYFAELSEAYFAVNDFAPYTRSQLRAHDPEGFALVERMWGLSGEAIAAARTTREDRADAGAAGRP